MLGVAARTLRRWRSDYERGSRGRPVGRPPHPLDLRWRCLYRVAHLLKEEGMRAGEERLKECVQGRYPQRLVREAMAKIKRRWRARMKRLREALRITVKPATRDVLWSLDACQLGKVAGQRLYAQLVVDPGEPRIIGQSLGPEPVSEDAVALLEHLRRERGAMPLVLVTDNGANYVSRRMTKYLKDCPAQRNSVRLR